MMRSRPEWMLAFRPTMDSGSELIIRLMVSIAVIPANGMRPVAISYKTTPRLNRSDRWSTVCVSACSGDM